jgi:hypothetical protein
MTGRQDDRDAVDRQGQGTSSSGGGAGGGNRANPAKARTGNRPGAMHGVGKEAERPDLEQKIDESRSPAERTRKDGR